MGKSTVVLSLSVPPDMPEQLNSAAAKRNCTRSTLSCDIFKDFMYLQGDSHETLRRVAEHRGVLVSDLVEYLIDRFSLEDASVKPIVLKIPIDTIQDRAKLECWLQQKVAAIVNHLHPNTE